MIGIIHYVDEIVFFFCKKNEIKMISNATMCQKGQIVLHFTKLIRMTHRQGKKYKIITDGENDSIEDKYYYYYHLTV